MVPDGTLTARNAIEIFVEWFTGFVEGVLGHEGRSFVPSTATFFLFILAANLIGLIPGFVPPTSNFNITLRARRHLVPGVQLLRLPGARASAT